MHILIVRKNSFSFGSVKIVIPDANQRQDYRQVFVEIFAAEVIIHGVCTFKQLDVVIVTNSQNNGQTDGQPQRITAAYPVPEAEHVSCVDAKGRNRFSIGRNCHKMFGNVCNIICRCQEPVFGRIGVGHCFLRSKGLRSHNKQCCFRVNSL